MTRRSSTAHPCVTGACAVLAGLLAALPAWAASDDGLDEEARRRLCGPLCLTYCAQVLGVQAELEEVKAASGWQPQTGTSLAQLGEAARALGLEARAYRLGLSHLRRLSARTPGIAHVDGNHYVVVWGEGAGGVAVRDLPRPQARADLAAFGRRWDGAILIVSLPGEQPRWGPRPAWWAAGAGLLATVVLAGVLRRIKTRRRGSGAGRPDH